MKINKIGSLKYSEKSGDFTKQVKIRKTFFSYKYFFIFVCGLWNFFQSLTLAEMLRKSHKSNDYEFEKIKKS